VNPTLVAIALLATIPAQDAPEKTADPAAPPVVEAPDFREFYAVTPVTRAVDRGVEYLASKQLPDGSWLSPGYGKNTGIVSLAVMALMARGHEPGRGEHGEVIERAVAWILKNQKSGLVIRDTSHGELYSHGISTLMLGEVVGMIDDERPGLESIHRVHRTAVNLILRAQNIPKDRWNLGGWRYTPSSEVSDISVSGWQLLALRAAKDVGLPVPKKNISQAVGYIARCKHPTGGFSYQPGGDPNTGRTGTGILALEICGEHGSDEAKRGGDWLLRHPPKWSGPFFYYGAYYSSQAMYQLGGRYWKDWQPVSERLLVEKQAGDGSWPAPPGATHEEQAGPIYATAMAILSLSVEFRYLPIYQR
jgi:hypothetical protein